MPRIPKLLRGHPAQRQSMSAHGPKAHASLYYARSRRNGQAPCPRGQPEGTRSEKGQNAFPRGRFLKASGSPGSPAGIRRITERSHRMKANTH